MEKFRLCKKTKFISEANLSSMKNKKVMFSCEILFCAMKTRQLKSFTLLTRRRKPYDRERLCDSRNGKLPPMMGSPPFLVLVVSEPLCLNPIFQCVWAFIKHTDSRLLLNSVRLSICYQRSKCNIITNISFSSLYVFRLSPYFPSTPFKLLF